MAKLTPESVASALKRLANSPLEELEEQIYVLDEKTCQLMKLEQEAAEKRQAELFVKHFPAYVEKGLRDRLHFEKKPPGKYDEPGFKESYLRHFRGLITVFEFESRFQHGPGSNSQEFQVPGWLQKAKAMLEKLGWQCEFKSHLFVEVGVGNTLTAYLCISDPRIKKEKAKK